MHTEYKLIFYEEVFVFLLRGARLYSITHTSHQFCILYIFFIIIIIFLSVLSVIIYAFVSSGKQHIPRHVLFGAIKYLTPQPHEEISGD